MTCTQIGSARHESRLLSRLLVVNHDIKLLFSSKGITHYKVNISVVAHLAATTLPASLPLCCLLCCPPHRCCAACLAATMLPALPLLHCPPRCHHCGERTTTPM